MPIFLKTTGVFCSREKSIGLKKFRNEITILDGIAMKGRRIIISVAMPGKALK